MTTTHQSRNPHGVICEPLTCASVAEGKGREGKGRGGREETPIHSSSYVTRAARDGWMGLTSTIPETRDDVAAGGATIEGIDLEADVPCTLIPKHEDHPAELLVSWRCPAECGNAGVDGLCWRWWALFGKKGVICAVCRAIGTREGCMRILQELR